MATIAKDYTIFSLELIQSSFFSHIATFAMGNRQVKHLSPSGLTSECALISRNFNRNRPADEFQFSVAYQGSREQSGFCQNLKAIAYSENQAAVLGESADSLHHRGKFGNRSATKVVAVAETTR